MMKRKEFMLGATFGLVLAAGATAGGVIDWPSANAGPVAGVSGRLTANAGAAGLFAPPQGAPLSFADIFQQVAPAVVQIDVEAPVELPPGGTFRLPGTPFSIPIPQPEEGEEPLTTQGAGSGFFISAEGYIVTNNHVVENATEIRVTLADGRELEATLVGRDVDTDLAVIKVQGSDFPFVSFEEDAQPRVGDWVIAVGNPFGLGGTATAGIVSATGRSLPQASDNPYTDFLQIDAAINRGNSGGPTFDIYGRVIGVNSAIFSTTGGSVGVGFAIPASIAKDITDRLMRGEAIQRGYLGAQIGTVTPDIRESLGLPAEFEAAYINEVTPDAPAERAGLRAGDIVTSLNGEKVETSTELTRLVGAANPGDRLRLEILREGRRQTVEVRSGTRPANINAVGGPATPEADEPPTDGAAGEVVEGLTLAPLTASVRSQFDLPARVEGLVINAVAPNSRAARLGVQPGMVIMQANARPVRTVADFRSAVEAVRQAGRTGILLLVRTPAGNSPVVLPLASD